MSGPFDADALLREYGDPALVHDLARLLVDTLPPQLDAVQSAIDTQDGPGLRAAAHKLKGSLGAFGVPRAVDLARALEALGSAGTVASAGGQHDALRREVLDLLDSARAWLSDQPGAPATS